MKMPKFVPSAEKRKQPTDIQSRPIVKQEHKAPLPMLYFPLLDSRIASLNMTNPRPVLCHTRDQAISTGLSATGLAMYTQIAGLDEDITGRPEFSDMKVAYDYFVRALATLVAFGVHKEGDYFSLKVCKMQGTFVEVETIHVEKLFPVEVATQ